MRLLLLACFACLALGGCGGGDDAAQPSTAELAQALARAAEAPGALQAKPLIAAAEPAVPSRAQAAVRGAAVPRAAAESVQVPQPQALFDWAAGAYPQFFSGASTDGHVFVRNWGIFSFRYFYGSNNYVGVLNAVVYVYGPMSSYRILAVGDLVDFTCRVYSCPRMFVDWTRTDSGKVVQDANGDSFAFYTDTGCLYSYASGLEGANMCLSSDSIAKFGQATVYIDRVARPGGGCMAVLSDFYGYGIDVYVDDTNHLAFTPTFVKWDYTGCG